LESISPQQPGITIGLPVGALPPPGLYGATTATFFSMHVYDQSGQSTGIVIRDYEDVVELLYVPDIPQFLGATYGASIVQPIRAVSIGLPHPIPNSGTYNSFGIVDTVINPLTLSWNLQVGLFVSFSAIFYPPDGTYSSANVANVGRHYFTFEPGFGISYLAGGWNITLHPVLDFSATNPANGYRSGNVFEMDYTFAHTFGAFNFGVGGTLTTQFTNDTLNGVTLANIPGVHGYGNRASEFSVGPVFGYDFGPVTLTAYYTRDVYVRNYAGGNKFYARLNFPFSSTAPAKAEAAHSSGPR
jgi:hypothetical protein